MRIRRFAWAFAALLAAAFATPASAALLIHIDKSTQRMAVSLDGAPLFDWPVSTGVAGYDTPSGDFKPFRMERKHFSREWDDAPMPHSIFFTQRGHAIHGSYHKSIGRPASHGCVRLAPKNAHILFDLVRQEGMANTRVVLDGVAPSHSAPLVAERGDTTDDDDVVGTVPQRRTARGWREYSDGPRFYYYRERPYYPPPRRYRYAPGPFEFLFGR